MAMAALSVSFKTTAVPQQAADIGGISELNGSAQIQRDQTYPATLEFAIQSNDAAITNNGRMAITFLDDSVVKLTEHSELVINEYVYDPDPSKSKMALTFALGTTRFITGNLNRIDKQNIALKTPTANIAIRGTDFSVTVNELGSSLIILLPDALGLSSGEIEVMTATGSVLLNKPFEATTVDVFESAPSKPVILDLTLDVIDNMLIVTPPEEQVFGDEQVVKVSRSNLLDVDFLEFNDLDIDYLAEDDLQFTELLDVIDALAVAEEEDALGQDLNAINIVGTKLGQDLDTQITSFVTGQTLTLMRNVSANARIDLDVGGSYTVIFIQDGVSKVVTVNGGGNSVIKITQSN